MADEQLTGVDPQTIPWLEEEEPSSQANSPQMRNTSNEVRLAAEQGMYLIVPRESRTPKERKADDEYIKAMHTRMGEGLKQDWTPSISDTLIASAASVASEWTGLGKRVSMRQRKLSALVELNGMGDPNDVSVLVPDRFPTTPEWEAKRDALAKSFVAEQPPDQRDRFYWVKNEDDVRLVRSEQERIETQEEKAALYGEIMPCYGAIEFVMSSLTPNALAAMYPAGKAAKLAGMAYKEAALYAALKWGDRAAGYLTTVPAKKLAWQESIAGKLSLASTRKDLGYVSTRKSVEIPAGGLFEPLDTALPEAVRVGLIGMTKSAGVGGAFGALYAVEQHGQRAEVGLPVDDLGADVLLNAMYGAAFGFYLGAPGPLIRGIRTAATEHVIAREFSKSEAANKAETIAMQKRELFDSEDATYSHEYVAGSQGTNLTEFAEVVNETGERRPLSKRVSDYLARLMSPVITCLSEKIPAAAAFHIGTHQHSIIKYRLTGELPVAELIEQDIGKYFQVSRGRYEDASAAFVKARHGTRMDYNDAYIKVMHSGIETGNPLIDKVVAENRELMKQLTEIASEEGVFDGTSYEHALIDVDGLSVDEVAGLIMQHNEDKNAWGLARQYAKEAVRQRDAIGSEGGPIILGLKISPREALAGKLGKKALAPRFKVEEIKLKTPGFFYKSFGEMTGEQMAAWSNSRILKADLHRLLSVNHGENILYQAKDWIARGLKKFPTVKGSKEYFPVRWNEELILKNEAAFKAKLTAALVKQDIRYQMVRGDKSLEQAQLKRISERVDMVVDSMYGRSLNGERETFVRPKRSISMERVLDIDPTDMMEFLSKNTYSIQESFTRQVSFEMRTRQLIRAQGWDKEHGVRTFDEYAEEVVTKRVQEAQRKGTITRKEADAIIRRFNALREIYGGRGRAGSGNKRVDDVLRAVSAMNFMSKCGCMLISLISDLAHSAFRGPGGMARHIHNWASECFGNLENWGFTKEDLLAMRVGLEGMRNNSRFIAAMYEEGMGGRLERMVSKFGKLTGIEFAERMRSHCLLRAIGYEMCLDVTGSKPMAYKNKLHNSQLTPELKKRCAKMLKEFGDMDHENFDVGLSRWTDHEAKSHFVAEMKRLHSMELIQPGPMQMHEVFRSGYGRFFYAFHSYIAGLSSNLLGPLLANGNYGELAHIMVYGYGLALLLTKTRAAIQGRDLEWDDPELYEHAVTECPTGIAGYAINPLVSGICKAADGELRMASSKDMLYSVVGNGPGGWVLDVIDSLRSMSDVLGKVAGTKEGPVTKMEVKRMLKCLPMQNLIYLSPILGYGLYPHLEPSPQEKKRAQEKQIAESVRRGMAGFGGSQ